MPITPLRGYIPDVEPTQVGVMTDIRNLIPTMRGYKAAPTLSSTGVSALSATAIGGLSVRKLDGITIRTFAGTSAHLYELNGTSWTDKSRAANYTCGSNTRWRFAQFGDVTLAANKSATLQAITSGNFADIATAPAANCIDVSQGFVMLGDTNDGTYGDNGDRWWCSAIYDYTTWTPSVATQATTGRLVDSPGRITGIKSLGANFVAYKEQSMFLGNYVGAPMVWQWNLIPGEIGCPSQDAIASIGTAHIFMGRDDFYLFDGSRPIPIGDGIRVWFFQTELNHLYKANVQALHDRQSKCVWFFYPSATSTGSLNAALVYNYATKQWGRADIAIDCVIDYQSASTSIDAMTGTYAAETRTYDAPEFIGGDPYPSAVNTSHVICLFNGTPGVSLLQTWDIGDDWQLSTVRRVRPRFLVRPTQSSLQNKYKMTAGDTYANDASHLLGSSDTFCLLRSARWHQLTMSCTGPMEIDGINLDITSAGTA
jgi:hypothetical protein